MYSILAQGPTKMEGVKEMAPVYDGWAGLPDIILSEIFSFVSMRNLARCRRVCQNWLRVTLIDRCWETFVYRDFMFTRKRFTLHSGYEHAIDHWKLRFLINNVTRKWRHVVVKPFSLLINFYEFIRVITNFTEYYENQEEHPLENIRTFDFEWELHVPKTYKDPSPEVFGTGGRLLNGVSMLISHFRGLKALTLRQLLLEEREADAFMDELQLYFGERITTLCVLNLTKTQHSFFHLGLFLHLRKLCVSPQHLNDDVVYLLSGQQNLRDIFLIQDKNTTPCTVAVDGRTWRDFRKSAPRVRVHLRIRGRGAGDLVWQLFAPVFSIVYDTPNCQLTAENAVLMADNYSETLEIYVQRGIQRRFRARAFEDRADTAVMMLVRHCRNLKSLAIRECLSTATLLIIAQLCSFKEEFFLSVRRNSLLKRSDWPYDSREWSAQFYDWLKTSARDYDKTQFEVERLLKGKGKIMSDKEYKYAFRYSAG